MPETDWLTWTFWTGSTQGLRDLALIVAAVVGLPFVIWRTIATHLQSKAALRQADTASKRHEQQTDADRQRRITDSFAQAIELLGSEKLEVRLGAIYALERIARESPIDHGPIMETLTAYVREKVPLPYPDKEAVKKVKKDLQETGWRLPADVQAALTVVGRRSIEQDVSELTLQLEGTNLTRANLENAHLERANLTGAFLTGALLAGTHLENADLSGAQLEGAILDHTHLFGGFLDDADLKGAFLRDADLSGADLSRANLSGADLSRANLRAANLSRVYLSGADLSGANLRGADLSGVQVSALGALPENFSKLSRDDQRKYMRQAEAYLIQEQLKKACGDAETKLPEGLMIPFCDDEGQSAPDRDAQ